MQTVLITGGAGFIGSNFIPFFLEKNKKTKVVNLDDLTYAGDLENLKELTNHPRYFFEKGDICNRNFIEEVFRNHQISDVIHFAAESHVDNSIKNPDAFVKTNVFGTFTLLDVARDYWMHSPNSNKENFKESRFHHVA